MNGRSHDSDPRVPAGPIATAVNDHRFHGVPAAFVTGALFLVAALKASAQDIEQHTWWDQIQEKGLYERVWDKLTLYEDEDNPVIEYFTLIGRYQGQYWAVDSGQGSANGWENRRMFMGAEAMLFQQFRVQAQIRVSEDFDPFYDGLYQAFVQWSPADAFSLTVGRLNFQMAGLERSMSSAVIPTVERGLLVNQIMPAEVVGAVANGTAGNFSYRAGVLSGSINQEFTDFQGGVGMVAGLGYNLPLFYQTGSVHLDYLFNDGNSANNALRPYDHVVSLWHQGQSGPFGLGMDLTGGLGLEDRPAVFGVTLLPTYVFAKNVIRKGDALQAVLRYQLAVSAGNNGLQLQRRYEREVVPNGSGNRYQAGYAGINYLIFGDRFKLMNGLEYSVLYDSGHGNNAFNGWTYLAAVRVLF